jgi:hypothetical protein
LLAPARGYAAARVAVTSRPTGDTSEALASLRPDAELAIWTTVLDVPSCFDEPLAGVIAAMLLHRPSSGRTARPSSTSIQQSIRLRARKEGARIRHQAHALRQMAARIRASSEDLRSRSGMTRLALAGSPRE